MTKGQLSQALKIAQSNAVLSSEGSHLFCGCALSGFKQITVTMEMLSYFLRWHTIYLDGSVDAQELNDIARYGKKAFFVV